MVKKLFNFLGKEIIGIHEAAYLLAIFAFVADILALIRDRLFAGTFGASTIIDVYYASFKIPDLMFSIFAAFISALILVPLLSKHLENREHISKIINSLFILFVWICIGVSIVVFIFTKPILNIFFSDILNGQYGKDLILFTRLLLLSPLILGISQLLGSVIQTYKKFFVYAISPLLYNIGIILGIIYFYPIFGPVGLVFGVILGLILHVGILIPTVLKLGLFPSLFQKIDFISIKEVVRVSVPRTVTLASGQIVIMFLTSIASGMVAGSIAVFNFANNLQAIPLSIIGVSYSLAAFPTLSRLFVNNKLEEFFDNLIISVRHVIFWSIPVTALFIVLRAQIVRTILGSGAFDWNDTKLTAAIFAIFSLSVIAQSLILLFVRAYYSMGDTKKPLFFSVFSSILTIFLAFALVRIFDSQDVFRIFIENLFRVSGIVGTNVLMLPLAFSLGITINALFLWFYFEKRFNGFTASVWKTLYNSLIASIIGGYVSYLFLQVFDDIFNINTLVGIFSQGFFAGILGLIVWFIVLKIMKNSELEEISNVIYKKIWRAKPIFSEDKEI